MIDAFLFDLDGVIIDSMPLHTVAWREYLTRFGFDAQGVEHRMHGKRNDEIVAEFWGREISPEENFAHGAAKEALFREMMDPMFAKQLVPGVAEFLRSYGEVPKAVATNAEPANAEYVLSKGELKHYFQAVVDGMQVQNPKPYPDVYLRAASLLGVDPSRCIVFEDSPTGVAAGLAAGARVIGVATHAAKLDGVELMIPNFEPAAGLHEWLEREGIRKGGAGGVRG
ncbi:MAG: HAD-IA family hydrolase [Acidobacteria bacterium]|nr:HAD-IA family hydrolase [Acidobacteriota bacterium]